MRQPRRGGQGERGHQARGAARGRRARPLAADRRGDRRVPVPVRREGRGHQPGRRSCSKTSPAAAAARASTSCWPARTSRGSRRSGCARRSSSSSCCGSACPGPAGCSPRATTRRCTCPRWHAVVNHESGVPHGNEILRIPEASKEAGRRGAGARCTSGTPASRTRSAAVRRQPGAARRRADREACAATDPPEGAGRPVHRRRTAAPPPSPLPAVPGRNVGVIGAGGTDAVRVLAAAALSLGEQHDRGGRADFVLAPLVAEAVPTPRTSLAGGCPGTPDDRPARQLRGAGRRLRPEMSSSGCRAATAPRPTWCSTPATPPTPSLERAGTEALRKVLRFGPETGVHTIGWWRSPARLRSLLSMSASPDDLGCVVAPRRPGRRARHAAPPGLLPVWSPRPGRALIFDRARHARPEVVIVPAVDGRSTDERTSPEPA